MAAASKSPIQANSPWSRQPQRSSAAHGFPFPPPLSLSEAVDQEEFVTSSSTESSDTLPSKEAIKMVAASGSLIEDGYATGADAQLDDSENCGAAKKPAWNKPSNGVTAEVGAVMDAESWPALSESARASPKSSSTSYVKALSNGSMIVSEKEIDTNLSTANSTSNHVAPTSQRSMKHGGDCSNDDSMPANDNLSQAPPKLGAVAGPLPQNAGNSSVSVGESNKGNTRRDSGQRGRSFGGNELQMQHGPFRSSNGPQARGDGSYHQRQSARRDTHRNFGSRDSLGPHRRDVSRSFIRGSSPNTHFLPPPVAMPPFVSPVVYQELPPHVFYVPGPNPDSMPMVPYSPMLFTMPDPHLPSKISNQIEYYFSNENLVKDTFLRHNMDGEGWVSIGLIASFNKVMQLTDNLNLILDAVKASNVVEVQGDKVRRKGDWFKWIMSPTKYSSATNHSIRESSQDVVAVHLNSVTLGEKATT